MDGVMWRRDFLTAGGGCGDVHRGLPGAGRRALGAAPGAAGHGDRSPGGWDDGRFEGGFLEDNI